MEFYFLTSVLFIMCLGGSEAQMSWFQRQFMQHQQKLQNEQQPVYPSFPIITERYNFQPQANFGFDPINGRLIGFDPAPFDFHASKPDVTTEPKPTTNKEIFPIPTTRPTDSKPTTQRKVSNVFQAGISNRVADQPAVVPTPEPQDACSNVVCPQGTLCSVHPSQCNQPPCPDFAVCTQIKAIDSCKQPVVTGSCSFKYDSFYFNTVSGKCEPFIYTGCNGNNNRFSTLEQCQQVCIPNKKLCHLAKETGPCRAAKPKWYFDQASQTCLRYIYGGCRGNSNSFETRTECMKMCSQE